MGQKKLHTKLMAIILSNLYRFSKFFHWRFCSKFVLGSSTTIFTRESSSENGLSSDRMTAMNLVCSFVGPPCHSVHRCFYLFALFAFRAFAPPLASSSLQSRPPNSGFKAKVQINFGFHRGSVAEWLACRRPGFKSQSRRCRVTVLGELFTPIVLLFTKQQNW